MKNDALKKHHFWILFGVAPLFTLIAVLVVSSSVGGEIDQREAKIKKAKDDIAKKLNPKPNALLVVADERLQDVGKKQVELHKDNWNRQKNLFTWPAGSPLLKDIENGETNIDRVIDQIGERLIEREVASKPPAQCAAEAKKARAELAQLAPDKRGEKIKAELDQLSAADRKAVLEPAWPKFGDPLPTARGEFEEFKNRPEAYLYEFSSLKKDGSGGPGTGMADRIAPTQFKGGWRSVLRHVNQWPEGNLSKDQVWLMMEDIWVQRSLLDAVRSVNAEMSEFRRGKPEKDGGVGVDKTFDSEGYKLDSTGKRIATPDDEKRKALFRNRTWAIELQVVKEGNDRRLVGKLTNLSDRLQLLGVGNTMTLNVWFSHTPTDQPIPFHIGSELLPGKGALKKGTEEPANVLDVVPTADHILPASKTADEIVRVEQVFDIRTVPVKRVEALALGKLDSRNGDDKALLPPKFIPVTEPAAGDTPPTGGGGGERPSGSAAGQPMGVGAAGGPGVRMPGGYATGATTLPSGGGPIAAVIDGNKKRYLEVTDQVRRMPVAIVLVVDQAYMQDTLLAFANSPLRFQITQVEWTRFRGQLDGVGSSSGSTGDPNGVIEGRGNSNITGSGDPDYNNLFRPKPGGGPRGSGAGPRPMGPGTQPPGSGTTGFGPRPPEGMGTSGFGSSGTGSSIASESQITSGLVELSIYGIVSLYEKYTETPATPATAQPAGTPAAPPGAPPAGPPAVPPGTPAPKKRRRIRKLSQGVALG